MTKKHIIDEVIGALDMSSEEWEGTPDRIKRAVVDLYKLHHRNPDYNAGAFRLAVGALVRLLKSVDA